MWTQCTPPPHWFSFFVPPPPPPPNHHCWLACPLQPISPGQEATARPLMFLCLWCHMLPAGIPRCSVSIYLKWAITHALDIQPSSYHSQQCYISEHRPVSSATSVNTGLSAELHQWTQACQQCCISEHRPVSSGASVSTGCSAVLHQWTHLQAHQ